jgi:addiction module HigA family antidote
MSKTHLFHPGTLIRDCYLEENGLTQTQLAKGIGVPQSRISELCAGKRDITADLALRLGKFFNTTPQMFINLQNHYDFSVAEAEHRKAKLRIRPFTSRAERPAAITV